jgi:hypothetical protein
MREDSSKSVNVQPLQIRQGDVTKVSGQKRNFERLGTGDVPERGKMTNANINIQFFSQFIPQK